MTFFELSYLQLFWLVQAILYLVLTVSSIVTGRHWDKSQSHRDPDGRLGWLEFRKRPGWLNLLALLFVVYIIWTVLSSCLYGSPPNEYFTSLYDGVTSPRGKTSETTSIYLALGLYLVHVSRRLYESLFVSIFSKRQVIGPLSFLLDHLHYVGTGLSLIADSPEFTERDDCFTFGHLHWYHLVAIVVFYFASKIHHSTHAQLASLRRNKSGHIVTTNYKMPKGGWFETLGVSSPHYLAEILIYASIAVTLGCHGTTWCLLTAYVTANQAYHAYHTQQLYQHKFDDYPKDRKMLVPFLF